MRAHAIVLVSSSLSLLLGACAPAGQRAPRKDAGLVPTDAAADALDEDGGAPHGDGGVRDASEVARDASEVVRDASEVVRDAGFAHPEPEPEPPAPLTHPFEARATFYSDGPHGSCGFGADPWPYVIAPAEWMNGDGALCGAFVEITSRHARHPGAAANCAKGTTIVAMVTDLCPVQGNEEWCADPGVAHFDLGADAFAALADPRCGVVEGLEWRFVERPGGDTIRVVNKDGINAWWYAFFVHRHRYALVKAEVRDAGSSSWREARRQPWGAFVIESATGLQPPLDVRLTDVHGQVLVLDDVVTSLQPNAAFESGAQFPAGLGGGAPLPFVP